MRQTSGPCMGCALNKLLGYLLLLHSWNRSCFRLPLIVAIPLYCTHLVCQSDLGAITCSRALGLVPAHLNHLFLTPMRGGGRDRWRSKRCPRGTTIWLLQQALVHAWFLRRLKCPSLHPVPCSLRCRFEPGPPGSCHRRSLLQRRCACLPNSPVPSLLLPPLASWNSPRARGCCLGRKIACRLVRECRGR